MFFSSLFFSQKNDLDHNNWSLQNKRDTLKIPLLLFKVTYSKYSLDWPTMDFGCSKIPRSSPSVSTFFPISEFSYIIIRFLNHIFLSLTFLISLSDFTIELLSKSLIIIHKLAVVAKKTKYSTLFSFLMAEDQLISKANF